MIRKMLSKDCHKLPQRTKPIKLKSPNLSERQPYFSKKMTFRQNDSYQLR